MFEFTKTLRLIYLAIERQSDAIERQVELYDRQQAEVRQEREQERERRLLNEHSDREKLDAFYANQQRAVELNEQIAMQYKEHIDRCDAVHRRLLNEKAETLQ